MKRMFAVFLLVYICLVTKTMRSLHSKQHFVWYATLEGLLMGHHSLMKIYHVYSNRQVYASRAHNQL